MKFTVSFTVGRICFGFFELSSANNETASVDAQVEPPSLFAERFLYSRDRQRVLGTYQSDKELAEVLGLRSSSQITEYKTRSEAPEGERTVALARVLGVDPGWLAFGSESKAPPPDNGFPVWLVSYRMRSLDAAARGAQERLTAEAERQREAVKLSPKDARVAERPGVVKKRAAGGRGRKR